MDEMLCFGGHGLREECGPCMRLGYVYKKVLFLFLVTGILYGDSVCVAILRLCDELSIKRLVNK